MGNRFQNLFAAAFVLCGLFAGSGAHAATYNISGTDLLGDTLTGTIDGDATLSAINSINLIDSGVPHPLTNFTYFSQSYMIAANATPGPVLYVPIYLSFAGGPTVADASQALQTAYQQSIAAALGNFDPAICGTDTGCQASILQAQADAIATATAFYNYSVVVSLGSASATPLPAALPLFISGLGALGLIGWRRKRKAAANATA